jgi:hypothetical protein
MVDGPAGTRRIATQGRFRSAHVVTRTADGKKHIQCVTGEHELDRLLAKEPAR